MIDLYTARTPNGRKISIMLEECGLDYRSIMVDIGKGEQFSAAFNRVNPNAKIPAIVDHAGEGGPVTVFESGAILEYLAMKSGRFLPHGAQARATCMSWLFWQVANIGPMFGQANHFANVAPEKLPYAIERYSGEAARLVALTERELSTREYLAGDYSIADIATYPWMKVALDGVVKARPEIAGEGANIRRWLADIGARPAVARGMAMDIETA